MEFLFGLDMLRKHQVDPSGLISYVSVRFPGSNEEVIHIYASSLTQLMSAVHY